LTKTELEIQAIVDAISEPRRRAIVWLVQDQEPEGLAELRSFLDLFWEDRLELLKREAEQEKKRGRVARAARRN
jgi:hypothetical protein